MHASGASGGSDVRIHRYIDVQTGITSVGLAQARPNYMYHFSLCTMVNILSLDLSQSKFAYDIPLALRLGEYLANLL